MLVSFVIRSLNESRHLEELLVSIERQQTVHEREVVLVDSGSTDATLDIAARHGCRVLHIEPSQFSFGRSLNQGCEAARGEILVFISGHCIPCASDWLDKLVAPLVSGQAHYAYGRQTGRANTRFSEQRLFEKLFPGFSYVSGSNIFCNNANAALLRSTWEELRFDEDLTGLEDMMFARRLTERGGKVAYVAEAPVFHIHDETWQQVRLRYEREAVAMHRVMPEIRFGLRDFISCLVGGIVHDLRVAAGRGELSARFREIVMFRFMQFYGAYAGHRAHRRISEQRKREYFYPNTSRISFHEQDPHRALSNEAQQRADSREEFQKPGG